MDGLLYVVFGEEYDRLALYTIAHSRRFTNLPICILTNISDRTQKWDSLKNIIFRYFQLPQDTNREVKTKMIQYTPFDRTLYLDCDSVIQKPGVEKIFDLVENKDILLNLFLCWKKEDKVLQIYKKAMKIGNVDLPLSVYNGAFIAFNKNEKVSTFFDLWANYWNLTGRGREMPSLACAIKNSSVSVLETKWEDNFFAPDKINEKAIVQHNYNSVSDLNKDFFVDFGLPRITENKPFDTDPRDWSWVEF